MLGVMVTPILGVPVTRDSLNGVKNTANTIQIHKVIENKIPNGKSNNLWVSKRKIFIVKYHLLLKNSQYCIKYVKV